MKIDRQRIAKIAADKGAEWWNLVLAAGVHDPDNVRPRDTLYERIADAICDDVERTH